MFCDPIDVPNELLTAQEEGELVVFAGAGVSMGPPSDLPNFSELVNEIAEAAGKPRPQLGEPLDTFLGRLERQGVPVHDLCHKIIADPTKHPTPLHHTLLKLFLHERDIRVVTTNFDRHFASAARANGCTVREYHAPALPLGNDFRGIVHLHGSVEEEPKSCVLTDRDFARAYLTEGWARTFLQALYRRYTVLFIGYSHDDTLVSYLAYGISSEDSRRFALHPSDHPGNWEQLGVRRIPYEKQPAPHAHRNLQAGLQSWIDNATLQPLDVEARIARICAAAETATAPAADPSGSELQTKFGLTRGDADFLHRWLERENGVLWFCSHARAFRLVEWLNERGAISEAFAATDKSCTNLKRLARWLVERLIKAPIGDSLKILEAHGGILGPAMWRELVWSLAFDDEFDNRGSWVGIALASYRPGYDLTFWPRVIERMLKLELYDPAVALFDCMLGARLIVREGFDFGKQQASRRELRLSLLGGAHELQQLWWEQFKPLLDRLAPALLLTLEARVAGAYALATLIQNDVRAADPLEDYRKRIEAREYPHASDSEKLLVDFLVDVVSAHCYSRGGIGKAKISQWLGSGRGILVRVALFALRSDPTIAAKDKFRVLVQGGLVYPSITTASRDARELISSIYAGLDRPEKEELWRLIEAGPPPSRFDWMEAPAERIEEAKREADRFVAFLARRHAGDELAAAAMERLRARSPDAANYDPDRVEREFPSGPVEVVERSPISVDDLLKVHPEEQLGFLLSYKGEGWPKESREGLINAVIAAAKNQDWCINLMRSLAGRGAWTSDIWPRLLWSTKLSSFPPEIRLWLLQELPRHWQGEEELNSLTYFFFAERGFGKEQAPTPAETDALLSFSLAVWSSLRKKEPEPHKGFEETDYTSIAINRAAGRIVEFWLAFTEHRKASGQLPHEGWPAQLADAFDDIAAATSEAGRLGLAVVAGVMGFARYVAPTWTKQKLYPRLRFDQVGDEAFLVWKPLLFYGRFSRDLLIELPEYFLSERVRLAGSTRELALRFASYTAIIAHSGLIDVWRTEWLVKLVVSFPESLRVWWTRDISRIVGGSTAERLTASWTSWARPYWEGRLNGMIAPLNPDEANALVAWPVCFWPSFDDAFALLQRSPVAGFYDGHVFYDLNKIDLASVRGETICDYLVFVLSKMDRQGVAEDQIASILRKIVITDTTFPRMLDVCHALARLGVVNAAKIKADVEERRKGAAG